MVDKFILKTGSSLFPKICRSYFLFTPHGLGDFLDQFRGNGLSAGIGHHEHGLDAGIQGAVHANHLKFIFEIGDRTQAALVARERGVLE